MNKIKKLWKEHWLLKRIKKTLPKDYTGRMKGEFNMGGDLMDVLFCKNKKGLIEQVLKKKSKPGDL